MVCYHFNKPLEGLSHLNILLCVIIRMAPYYSQPSLMCSYYPTEDALQISVLSIQFIFPIAFLKVFLRICFQE